MDRLIKMSGTTVSQVAVDGARLHQIASFLWHQILTGDGVADGDVSEVLDEAIFIEPAMALMINRNNAPRRPGQSGLPRQPD